MERAGKNTTINKFSLLPVHYFLLIYLLFIPISNIFHGNISNGLDAFIFFLKKACVFIMIVLVIDSPERLRKIVKFIVFLSVILAIQGVYQSIYGLGWAHQSLYKSGAEGMRVMWIGYWDGANTLCVGLTMAVSLAFGFVAIAKNVISKLIYLFFSVLIIYGVYLTNSRGGFVAFLALIPAYISVRFKGKKKYALLIIVCVILPLAMKFGPTRVASLDTKESSYHQRTWLWEQGMNMLQDNPIFGIGKGEFRKNAHQPAHSNYIQNFAEVGFVGSFFWLSMIYYCLVKLYKIFNESVIKSKDFIFNSLSKALFISFISFSTGTLFVTVEDEPFYMLLGLAASAIMIAKQDVSFGKVNFRFTIKDSINVVTSMVVLLFLYYLLAMREIL